MDTFNRVILSILFAFAVFASAAGMLLVLGVISPAQIQASAPVRQVIDFFQSNPTPVLLGLILVLSAVIVLSVMWLRGQFAGAARTAAGAIYEPRASRGPGHTDVGYGVVGKAFDSFIGSLPGVVRSRTGIYSDRRGELFAQSFITVKRGVEFHGLDERIRRSINREWLARMGSDIVRHDIVISLEQVEQRVA